MSSRPGSGVLRASDADRERVVALLTQAVSDGRLTLEEHAERTGRAYSARTLGELAPLTADLAEPSAQPIRLDTRRAVTAFGGKERREGRWVVPAAMTVSAIFGEVVLDFREALLHSSRVSLTAAVIGGTLVLIVPDGVAVEITGTALLGRTGRAEGVPRVPGGPVIEVRAMVLAGRIKTVVPRKPRWPWSSRRGVTR